MLRTRIIPTLLLENGGLVKTRRFSNSRYIGDPLNAVKIFNDKEVDELVFIDIGCTRQGKIPNFQLIENIASEAFMPFAYGGGVRSLEQAKILIKLGVEKIIINSGTFEDPNLIRTLAEELGSQSVVVAIDVRKSLLTRRYRVVSHGTKRLHAVDVLAHAKEMVRQGAGELLLTSIDREGTMSGYDLPLISMVSHEVGVPVVAHGGASKLEDFRSAVDAGAAAAAAGSLFVYQGKHQAVLITYPKYNDLELVFKDGNI